jgi:VanZ family protein
MKIILFIILINILIPAVKADSLSTVSLANSTLKPMGLVVKENLNVKIINLPQNNSGYSPISKLNVPDFDPFKSDINYTTLAGVGALYLGSGIGVHLYQANAWWKDNRSRFHFQNDMEYAIFMDKIGHFYGTVLLAHAFSAGLEAGNIPLDQAALWGGVMAFAFQMYVEIEDGFGPDWGFSISDAIADLAGAGFAISQYYFPFMKNFQFKFSYYPSKKYREGLHRGNIIDDYEGQKYWLSVRVKNILPQPISEYWPSFLNLAVGVQGRDLTADGGGYREYYFALDLDAEELPLYGKGWQFVKNTLNFFRIPFPGIRISPDAAFLVFCF